jgi:hypothetical protein
MTKKIGRELESFTARFKILNRSFSKLAANDSGGAEPPIANTSEKCPETRTSLLPCLVE